MKYAEFLRNCGRVWKDERANDQDAREVRSALIRADKEPNAPPMRIFTRAWKIYKEKKQVEIRKITRLFLSGYFFAPEPAGKNPRDEIRPEPEPWPTIRRDEPRTPRQNKTNKFNPNLKLFVSRPTAFGQSRGFRTA